MPNTSLPNSSLPLDDIQGNILRGYRMPVVRHFVLGLQNPTATRHFLAGLLTPEDTSSLNITSAAHWGDEKPSYCLNIAFTYAGLKALGLPQSSLDSFPDAFRQGAAKRAAALGDVGNSDPDQWLPGLAPTSDSALTCHILLSLYAADNETLQRLSATLRNQFKAGGAITEISCQDGAELPDKKVHFGYVDSLSQPHVDGAPRPRTASSERPSKTGDFVLGYEGDYSAQQIPQPETFGKNGTYCAYRILRQDVAGFENFLNHSASQTGRDKEWVAAKLCGRWRNGVPLALSPDTDKPSPALTYEQLNAFDYRPTVDFPDAVNDLQGTQCPIGSHIRRANPRSEDVQGRVHTREQQDGKWVVTDPGNPRRIIRRGIPYGPAYSPDSTDSTAIQPDVERGLLLLVICANLEQQFELMMQEWINGVQFTYSKLPLGKDALIGSFTDSEGTFAVALPQSTPPQSPITLTGMSRFVTTRGAAYGFVPGISALRYLAQPTC